MSVTIWKSYTLTDMSACVIHQTTQYLHSVELFSLSMASKFLRKSVLSYPLQALENPTSDLESLALFLKNNPLVPALGINFFLPKSEDEFSVFLPLLSRVTHLIVNQNIFQLNWMSYLSRLKELNIKDGAVDLAHLAMFCPTLSVLTAEDFSFEISSDVHTLTQLNLIDCDIDPILENLPLLYNLENFSCSNCVYLMKFPTLSCLTKLREFTFDTDFSLNKLSFLEGCLSLEKITLTCESVNDISSLSTCPQLKELSLGRLNAKNYFDLDLSPLSNLPLRKITLHKVRANFSEVTLPFTLEELSLINCFKNGQLKLANALNLKTCNVTGTWVGYDFKQLEGCLNLRELIAQGSHLMEQDIISLSRLSLIEKLHIASFQGTPLTQLSCLENLTELSLSDENFSNLTDLKGCVKLKRLTLRKYNKLIDISALTSLERLEEVTFVDCPHMINYGCLSRCLQLSKLVLLHCYISDLTSFSGSTTLKELDVRFCYFGNKKIPGNVVNLEVLVILNCNFYEAKMCLTKCRKLRVVVIEKDSFVFTKEFNKCPNLEYVEVKVAPNSTILPPLLDKAPKLTAPHLIKLSEGITEIGKVVLYWKSYMKQYELPEEIWTRFQELLPRVGHFKTS
jgi:hypothetical protein